MASLQELGVRMIEKSTVIQPIIFIQVIKISPQTLINSEFKIP